MSAHVTLHDQLRALLRLLRDLDNAVDGVRHVVEDDQVFAYGKPFAVALRARAEAVAAMLESHALLLGQEEP